MKTVLDMVFDAFSILDVSDVTTSITGELSILERPKNSLKEDIVINALPITGEQFQKGVFNVNVHVPNLLNVVTNGKPDETQPNLTRLRTISNLVVEKLRDVVGEDYHFNAQNGGYPIRENDDLSWYINIRVDYYSVQGNFTNI